MLSKLTPMQLDALKEVGNIGSGNAATAMAQFLDTEIHMSVPDVRILPLEDISGIMGGEETLVTCVMIKILGEAPGYIMFILEEESTYRFLDLLFPDQKVEELGEMERSALMELGNILSGSFLNAINRLTQFTCIQSLPSFALDMAGAILSSIALQQAQWGEQALFIESTFSEGEKEINSNLFLIPGPGSLEKILAAIGVGME